MAKYTTEQVIQQFKKMHGDKFDYSKVNYTHAWNKVIIICRVHGEFEQLVGMHRKGQGCAQCVHDDKRHSKEQVIQKFKKTHGTKYDYSLMEYINTDTKIRIVCSTHGEFMQTPDKHIQGNGCPMCIGRHKTFEDILLEFKAVHGDKYNYSEVEFSVITRKVRIVCPKHGIFIQTPQKHITGQGCPKCGGSLKLTLSEFIEQCREKHSNKYDYSEVVYERGKSKIKIICPQHGAFEQDAQSHKGGCGCPYCARNYNLETMEVIEQFTIIHSDRYEYTKVNYINAYTSIIITCREHGDFVQTPKSHKKGSGCPECVITIGHTKQNYVEYCNQYNGKTHLYLVRCYDEKEIFFKVGISRLGAKERFNTNLKMPYSIEIIEEIYADVSLIWDLEKSIHKLLQTHKYKPRLDFHGKTECFKKVPKSVHKLFHKFNNSLQLQLIM